MNCPKENKYYVFLSEMLVNTTISEIENEIKGVDDDLEVRYDKRDYVRFMVVESVNVTSVRKSLEKKTDKYVDSLIVVYVNETQSNDTSSDED